MILIYFRGVFVSVIVRKGFSNSIQSEVVALWALRAVTERQLTTLMVTHNMSQAIATGNRLIMMDAGRICYDVRGEEKSALTPEALVARFQIDNDRMLLKH